MTITPVPILRATETRESLELDGFKASVGVPFIARNCLKVVGKKENYTTLWPMSMCLCVHTLTQTHTQTHRHIVRKK